MPLNLSFTHLMVVGIVALVVLGPDRLPDVARTAGSLYREWKRIRGDLEGEVREAINEFKEPFLDQFHGAGDADGDVPPLDALPPLVAAGAGAGDGHPLAAALPVLGPGTDLVSPGPVVTVEIPTLGSGSSQAPPPDPGTFSPFEPPAPR